MPRDDAYIERQTELLNAALAEANEFAAELKCSLPESLEAAALGVREKAPFQLLSVREAIIWRTEELARNACCAIKKDDLTAAAILTRAIVESVAVIWKFKTIVERDDRSDLQKLNDELMNVFAASKVWSEEKRSYQILNFVDLLDKTVPKARKMYDDLSEISHPNWQGVAGMYSELDRDNHRVNFGRGGALHVRRKAQIAILLSTFLSLFKSTYNKLSDLMPEWINKMNRF